MSDFAYKGICHTKCYWLNTLWDIGETYEGDLPLIKHFSDDGTKDAALPPPKAGSDPRSNAVLREEIEMMGVSVPKNWSRKKVWARLKELQEAEARDAITAKASLVGAACGFEAKNLAGAKIHERQCEKCQEILGLKEVTDGNSS